MASNPSDESLAAVIHDAAIILADRLRPQLLELESAGKTLKTELARVKQGHERDVQYYLDQISGLKDRVLLQERVAEFVKRPIEHQHDPDEPNPVITLDWDGTIKPEQGYANGGDYPILVDPFPQIKKWLDRWASRKACIHVATAGLYYGGWDDLEIYQARLLMLQAKAAEWGLPISIFLPKIPSDLYYDDRMTTVPRIKNPDWDAVGILVEKDLNRRFDLVDGIWIRKDKKKVGTEIEEFPDIETYPTDHPRGYSGPRLDVDMHRTLSLASSSLRVAAPRPYAVEAITQLYNNRVTIRISCAGWNPKTHTLADSQKRLAGIRMWLMQNSIPYDRIVTKDHADAYIDDKGLKFTSWEADLPVIMKKLPTSESYRHGD